MDNNTSAHSSTEPVRIWDLPTRIFHGLWITFFVLAWVFHEDNRYLNIHVFAGYAFLALLLFRLFWGLFGSHYARFRHFFYTPGAVVTYLKCLLSIPQQITGHNPVGAWAIFILLGLGLVVSLSGLITLGAEERQGPLATLFHPATGLLWHEIHEFLSWLMLAVVAAHVSGVIIESILHRENLALAMINGNKQRPASTLGVPRHGKMALLLCISILLGAGFYFGACLPYESGRACQPFLGPKLPDNVLWREECGSCHAIYHPTLLPQRSWVKILDTQHQHFGEDLDLDTDSRNEIHNFLTTYAAETLLTEAAYKILRSIPPETTPLRITETAYWQKKHADISQLIWQSPQVRSRAQCEACHLDAAVGTYEDSAMFIPN
ncbi:cytochrome b/b6 domain-containing protein [Candidatus Venteria ishoeyi]|uniref:cytochrome b/b6 domain-containing protein n=1 Tax=Candidatus Venteria ishoeyi TaxID=1899563 RepID=UPI0025A52873|nr:cytochrome b/b6 domain-containing protein [Candidatus Venteria ishoeyi]MDM8547717.1 cytochrome b/b6 domain-containing protein [Candidatus Venteria ishoeyi]